MPESEACRGGTRRGDAVLLAVRRVFLDSSEVRWQTRPRFVGEGLIRVPACRCRVRTGADEGGTMSPLIKSDAKMQLLHSVPLFAKCNMRQLRRIAALTVAVQLPAGEALCREGRSVASSSSSSTARLRSA